MIEGGILGKALEGEFLGGKILQGSVDKLISSSAVVVLDDSLRLHEITQATSSQPLIDCFPSPKVCIEDGMRAGKVTEKLLIFTCFAAVDRPAKSFPFASSVSEFDIFPDGALLLVYLPSILRYRFRKAFQVRNQSPRTDVPNTEGFEAIEDLLIEKAAVATNHHWDVCSVMFPDLAHNVFDHFLDCIRVITVLVPGAKHGIDYETTPGHLQGCKAFDPLVGRPYTVPFWSLVIVHDHDVYAEHNGLGFLQFEPPDKELLEKTAEKIDSGPPKRTEESFHGMGGEHRIGWRLNGLGVTCVFAQLVEVDEVATRSIHKKTKDLFENLADGLPFAAFSKGAEESVKVRKQSDPRQIPYKQAQPAAAAQCFTCRRHIINSVFGTLITCDRILHVNLPPIGLTLWNPSWPTFSPQYQKLNPLGGISFCHESLDLGYNRRFEKVWR